MTRLAILALSVAGCGDPRPAPPRVVRVAAAADLKFAFDEAAAEFTRTNPDIQVQPIYGSSGLFYTQLTNNAPFDLYLSADIEYPRQLVAQGYAVPGSEFLYAIGRVVVWVPNHSQLNIEQLGLRSVLEPGVGKVAIANPRHAPYGRAAEAAMRHAGVYDAVQDRLVFGDNVAQAAQFVESGAADVGVIALSLAAAPTVRGKGRYWEIPLDIYPRLEQGGVILARAEHLPATRAVRDFLTGPAGRAVFHRYGFFPPGE